jgi:WD40 repeat protein
MKAGMSGTFFVTADRDNTVLVWTVAELKTDAGYRASALPLPDRVSLGMISSLAISPDERFIAAGFGSGHTLLWSTEDTRLMPFNVHHAHDAHVNALSFSSDSHWLATIAGDGRIHTTQLEKGLANGVRVVDSSSIQLLALAFFLVLPDAAQAPLLAIGTSDGRVLIYDVALERPLLAIPQEGPERKAIFHLAIAHINASTSYLLVGALNKAESWTLVFKPAE